MNRMQLQRGVSGFSASTLSNTIKLFDSFRIAARTHSNSCRAATTPPGSARLLDAGVVYLDLETTGATVHFDRITEIGLVEIGPDGSAEEWSALVNPGRRIPLMIETLTGITNAMVADAAPFEAVAKALYERLEGKLLVAHNARFDYGFLRNEFSRVGLRYLSRVLCTVKLSRRLYPQERRHNLDSLIARHDIECTQRHRALADARVLLEFTRRVRIDLGDERVLAAAQALLASPSLPTRLAPDALDGVPDAPGVYTFFGDNDNALYVGKSVTLRSRVLAHFSGDHKVAKDMRIAQEVTRVEWRQTAGELGALLIEARMVKRLMPVHNRLLRKNDDLCAWHWSPLTTLAPQLVSAGEIDFRTTDQLHGLFRSRTRATRTLREIAAANGLCPRLLGLEKGGSGPCFSHQIKKCRGACCGKETPASHNLRLANALYQLRIESWPFRGRIGIRETDRLRDRTEIHVIDRWCYLGTVDTEAELFDALDARFDGIFDLDTYQLLVKWLRIKRHEIDVIDLARPEVGNTPDAESW